MLDLTDQIFTQWLEAAQKVSINRLHPVASDEKFIRISQVEWGGQRRVGHGEYARINRTTGDIYVKPYYAKPRGNIYDQSSWSFGPKCVRAFREKDPDFKALPPIISIPKSSGMFPARFDLLPRTFDPTPYEDFELDDL